MILGAAVLLGAVLLAIGAGAFLYTTVDRGESISMQWISDTERPVGGNHHAVAAARIGGTPMIFAPVSGQGQTSQCALLGLYASNGSVRWTDRVPPRNCTIHAVADPTVGDLDGDGYQEVVAATTEEILKIYDAASGRVAGIMRLSSYGYTKPLIEDVHGGPLPELIVVDVTGSVFVAKGNGTVIWEHSFSSYAWGQPAVGDIDGTPGPEISVVLRSRSLYLFEAATGEIRWRTKLQILGSVTWMTTGNVDGDSAQEIVLATSNGRVIVYDGDSGDRLWHRDVGDFAAVRGIGDGDGDGTVEVYATARDGVLRALAAPSGTVEWRTRIGTRDEQMMPPPVLGDVDADSDVELVSLSNSGRIAVVDPTSGDVLASYDSDGRFYTHPTLADMDRDGHFAIFVMFGDGRVGKFEVAPDT